MVNESPRYVLALITHLPDNGALYASRLGGEQFRGWDASRYALAALVNAQRANNHILMMVNRDPKKSRPKPPELFPVPEQNNKPKVHKPGSFAAIAASMMAEQRRKRELLNGT